MTTLKDRSAQRRFNRVPFASVMDDGELLAISHPVGVLDVIADLSRRTAEKRRASQRPCRHPAADEVAPQGHGQFARGRDGENVGGRETGRARLRISWNGRVNLVRLILPRRAVNDRAIGSEPRRLKKSASKGYAFVTLLPRFHLLGRA